MKNIRLIYENVNDNAFKPYTERVFIDLNDSEPFNWRKLKKLIGKLKKLRKYYKIKKTIIINLGNFTFSDKAIYLIFDMMLYDIIKNTLFEIYVLGDENKNSIQHNNIKNTAFYEIGKKNNGLLEKNGFIKSFEKNIKINENSYKRLITRNDFSSSFEISSKVITDIGIVLKDFFKDNEWISDVCEAIGELIDNISAHTDSDCLIDVDVCEATKVVNDDDKVYILEIVIMNICKERIFDKVKENIKKQKYDETNCLYMDIYRAYENHKAFFNKDYREDDFFNITIFQNAVTSRSYDGCSSGTGLTTLIKKIIGKTTDQYAYVLSGNNRLFFEEDVLLIKDSFIGFNESGNYMYQPPDKKVIKKSALYFPGTIFRLDLVRSREESHV